MAILGAFMVPHPPMILSEVGKGREKDVEETILAYEEVADRIAKLKPETIVISSPHATMYADYFHVSPGTHAKGTFAQFGAPKVSFEEEYDKELTGMIDHLSREEDVAAGIMGEREPGLDHGTMVPLYFIRKKYSDFKLVRIGLSGLDPMEHYRVGQIIQKATNKIGRKIVFVASGDWSHKLQEYGPYGFAAEGPVYDRKLKETCEKADFLSLLIFDENLCNKAAECGHRSFLIMAGALDGLSVTADFLSYQDVTGVGYGLFEMKVGSEDEERRFLPKYLKCQEDLLKEKLEKADPYVKLAYQSIESFLIKHQRLDIAEAKENYLKYAENGNWSEIAEKRAGVFVSIHKFGRLRGCIGTIAPTTENIASEIIQNAISASTKDPRFHPIEPKEFKWLEIHVDVLEAPEKIESMEQLDVKNYGVIVTSGQKRGLLLPDLEGVDTVEQQVAIAMQKGGISPDEKICLERFRVVRHV